MCDRGEDKISPLNYHRGGRFALLMTHREGDEQETANYASPALSHVCLNMTVKTKLPPMFVIHN